MIVFWLFTLELLNKSFEILFVKLLNSPYLKYYPVIADERSAHFLQVRKKQLTLVQSYLNFIATYDIYGWSIQSWLSPWLLIQ